MPVIGVLGWRLDDIDVGALCWVCGPLDGYARPTDAGGDTVEEFEFRDKEMFQGFVSFSNPCPGVENSLLVLVEKVKCIGYFSEGMIVDGA